jgi:hypothetical protein
VQKSSVSAVIEADFSAKALGTFPRDYMMTLDRATEATLLQNNGPTTNHPPNQRKPHKMRSPQVAFGRAAHYGYGWRVSDRRPTVAGRPKFDS